MYLLDPHEPVQDLREDWRHARGAGRPHLRHRAEPELRLLAHAPHLPAGAASRPPPGAGLPRKIIIIIIIILISIIIISTSLWH